MSCKRIEERPGLPELVLEHGSARVRLSLQGAHITQFSIEGEELLWVSQCARFEKGAGIRGGIPLCWPWFGASLDANDWPQHGFARTSDFQLLSQTSDAHHTGVTLTLTGPVPVPSWEGIASLEVDIRLSDHLWMEARTRNCSDRDLLIGAGLHTYFAVSDSRQVSLPALTGLAYLDKTESFQRKIQAEPLSIEGEVDRVYQDPPSQVELLQTKAEHRIAVDAWGNTDLVVWNPGPTVAAAMADFDNEGYRRMVCVEPAIALDHRVRLAPGESVAIGQTLRRL